MDIGTVLSIVSIIVTAVLSVGAIVLSFWFYKESNKQNKETAIMQVEIKEAVTKLEKIYDRTYTDTFGALKTQMDAMQKFIFSSSVGDTNLSQHNKLRTFILGIVSQTETITIEDICSQMTDFKKDNILQSIYSIHHDGLIDFDGVIIKYKPKQSHIPLIEGEGVNPENGK
jgi:hypothetical protein